MRLGFEPGGAYIRVMDLSTATATSRASSGGRAGGQDPDARVAAIYVACYQQLAGLATMLTGSRALGEEIAQETFVIALQQERRNPGYLADPVWPWLRITAVRLAGRSRQRSLREALLYRLRRAEAEPSKAWDVETIDIVRALRRLPTRMRLCVILTSRSRTRAPSRSQPCWDVPRKTSMLSCAREGNDFGRCSAKATT